MRHSFAIKIKGFNIEMSCPEDGSNRFLCNVSTHALNYKLSEVNGRIIFKRILRGKGYSKRSSDFSYVTHFNLAEK